jgi:hypothetical protein
MSSRTFGYPLSLFADHGPVRPVRVLKRVFGYTSVHYRGMVKNHHWHLAGFALANLDLA